MLCIKACVWKIKNLKKKAVDRKGLNVSRELLIKI